MKTNLGPTEPVSGLAALIKTTFALKNRLVPLNLNYEKTDPEIALEAWHLKVPTVSVLRGVGQVAACFSQQLWIRRN